MTYQKVVDVWVARVAVYSVRDEETFYKTVAVEAGYAAEALDLASEFGDVLSLVPERRKEER